MSDAISSDAQSLGAAAAAVIEAHPDEFIDDVLLIDRISLDPEWRGNRLSGAIVSDLLGLLRLEPESTVVVLQPEPQKSEGGPFDYGPERDRALERLRAVYRDSGFESWRQTDIWWLPI